MAVKVLEERACFGGVNGFYTHLSEVCAGEMRFAVFQPPQAAQYPVPVLYFLAGLTCTPDNFTTKAGAQRVAAELGLILVMPDTSPRGTGYPGEDDDWDFGSGAGFYVDAVIEPWSASYRMYTYITQELPAVIDDHFPTAGGNARGIFGHSMGGHGALVIGLRDPTGWRSLSAMSPIVAPSQVPWGQKAFTGYLGADPASWAPYDATVLVAHVQHPNPILIDQGGADSFLDEQLRPHLFEHACAAAGQALELRVHPGYDHSYYFVASFVEDHLRHHASYLGVG